MRKAFIQAIACFVALWATASAAQTNLEIATPASWQTYDNGNSVRIEVARISNRSQNATSGTVHVILRATSTPEIIGSGYTLADINMANYADDTGRLGPGEGWTNISIGVPFTTPPDGSYYTHLAVVEYPNLTTVLDHITMSGITTFGPGSQPPNDDYGDSFSSATTVSSNSSRNGQLEVIGDRDVFRVTVPQSGLLSVSTSGSTDTVGALYDEAQSLLAQNDDSFNGGRNFGFDAAVTAGTYFIVVSGFDDATTGSYTLNIGFAADSATNPTPPVSPPVSPPPTSSGGGGGGIGWIGLMMLVGAAWRRRTTG